MISSLVRMTPFDAVADVHEVGGPLVRPVQSPWISSLKLLDTSG